eukprot:6387090-Karenia_brevis.AAC.1
MRTGGSWPALANSSTPKIFDAWPKVASKSTGEAWPALAKKLVCPKKWDSTLLPPATGWPAAASKSTGESWPEVA